jgi:uncharacterized protein YmfQ (DUF2313 family)
MTANSKIYSAKVYSSAAYASQILSLFPNGIAWDEAKINALSALASAMADELARTELRAHQLAVDWLPSQAVELLPDWERALALPDNCFPDQVQTLEQRQLAAVEKFTRIGLQTPAYFISLAESLGYTIEIEEYFPFSSGSGSAGSSVVDEAWAYTWMIRIFGEEIVIADFQVGKSTVGEGLRTWGNSLIECVVNRQKPAHTVVIYSYEGA